MQAARRPCPVPGCPELTDRPKGCARHRGQLRAYDNPAWRTFAVDFLRTHPLCQRCHNARATQVHHPQPIATHPSRALDPTNAMALCAMCHRQVTPTAHDTGNNPRRKP